jgi:shikimate dehydrogenase
MAKACVIGWPVEHSRSPLIYRYWLEHYGIDGAYEKEAVRPEDFPAFVEALAENGYVGANVTLPHKEAALRLARTADEAAIAIGAANTLWLDGDGRLHASNTDAYGFMTNLDAEAPQWNEGLGAAMVLGAGGAARAILYGLIRATDAKIFLANRTWKRAESLARRFGARVGVVDWDRRGEVLAACGLLINTTSLGMTGQAALDIDLAVLPQDAVVTDIVYNPLLTPLLVAAAKRGNPTVDGLGMLLYQAVPCFERWFGVRPDVTPALRAHVVASLKPEAA